MRDINLLVLLFLLLPQPIKARIRFIDPKRMSWPGFLICSRPFTNKVVTHQQQVERRTGEVLRPKTDVLYIVGCVAQW